MANNNGSRDLILTRIYDAPVQSVWEAWTDPEQVAKWWGPRGFSLTTHSKDLRLGGHWNYTMHGPDGTDYPNKTTYFEVEPMKKLVYDHGANDDQPAMFRVTVTFESMGSKTKMNMTMTLPTPEKAEQTKKFIKEAGGNATWDRLAEYLKFIENQKDIFVIHRSFNASIEVLFDVWTNPIHIAKWLAPVGVEMKYIEAEIAEGKTCFYKMTDNKDLLMFGKINYIKIQRPTQIQYTQSFCDKEGNMSRHPFAPLWPELMFTNVVFSVEPNNQTRITLVWEPYGKFTKEELQAFVSMKTSMTQGWTGSFDKLEAYLSASL